jgi:hypothetical protein
MVTVFHLSFLIAAVLSLFNGALIRLRQLYCDTVPPLFYETIGHSLCEDIRGLLSCFSSAESAAMSLSVVYHIAWFAKHDE